MPARVRAGKCARCRDRVSSRGKALLPLPDSDVQWIVLALSLTLASAFVLAPSAYQQSELVFVPPSRADLMLPPRNPLAVLNPQFRAGVIDRISALAPLHCGTEGGADARSAIFSHNFVLRDTSQREEVVNAHLVHFCGSPGTTMLNLAFKPTGSNKVKCAEEYAGDFAEKHRPAHGFLEYVDPDQGYRRVRRSVRNPTEACLAQHAVDILEQRWFA